MEFEHVFTKVGMVLDNHETYNQLKAEYMARGYTAQKARYAALGCMSGRTQGPTSKWYVVDDKVFFVRLA